MNDEKSCLHRVGEVDPSTINADNSKFINGK